MDHDAEENYDTMDHEAMDHDAEENYDYEDEGFYGDDGWDEQEVAFYKQEKKEEQQESGLARSKTCPVCTYDNFITATRCSLCSTIFEQESVQKQESMQKSEPYIAPDAYGPLSCPICTLINDPAARVCSACDHRFVAIEHHSVEHAQMPECTISSTLSIAMCREEVPSIFTCSSCHAQFVSSQEGYYPLESCRHIFCRACLVDWVGRSICMLEDREFNLYLGIACPLDGCETALSRQDIRSIAGHSVLKYLDSQVVYVLRSLGSQKVLRKNHSRQKYILMADEEEEEKLRLLYSAIQGLFGAYKACQHAIKLKEKDKEEEKKGKQQAKKEEEDYEDGYDCRYARQNEGRKNRPKQLEHQACQVKMDSDVFEWLKKLCKELKQSHNVVYLPYIATVLVCLDSGLRAVLSDLLRNDSTLDIAERASLYFAVFALFRQVATRPEIFPLMLCQHTMDDCWSAIPQGDASLISLMEKLYKQASFIMGNHVTRSFLADQDEKSAVEMALVAEAKHVFEELEQGINIWRTSLAHIPWLKDADVFFRNKWPRIFKKATAASIAPSTSTSGDEHRREREEYVAALKPFQFKQTCLLDNHYFRSKLDWKDGIPSRARRIAKEIAGLATNLPLEFHSSIHIRVDETRMDLLRALIIGPEGTPYQDGIFLFDILLGKTYPDKAPKVQFLTTGGGNVRFNPNLYTCGKVCLSLLGTWQGPSWDPSSSTILQVLVSLQSLVFVEDPYYNEPCYRDAKNKEAAESYNQHTRYHTLQYSILPALRDPDAAFAEVIRSHFKHKRHVIASTCDAWLMSWQKWYKEDKGLPNIYYDFSSKSKNQMGEATKEVKAALVQTFL